MRLYGGRRCARRRKDDNLVAPTCYRCVSRNRDTTILVKHSRG